MLHLEDTPRGLGVLPRTAALSKKSSLQQVLQERAVSVGHLEWGQKEERLAAFFYQESYFKMLKYI